jgi:hypothetical protein
MVRVPTHDGLILYRCYSCLTEIVKPAPRNMERQRVSSRERRWIGAARQSLR